MKPPQINLTTLGFNTMILIRQGIPLAKQRHRASVVKGKTHIYDTQTKVMNALKFFFAQQMRDEGFLKLSEGPVKVNLTAYMPKPRSWSHRRLKEAEDKPVTTKPDCDNIFKIYSDILNGIAYKDDAQISKLLVEKLYSDNPRVEIVIMPYKN